MTCERATVPLITSASVEEKELQRRMLDFTVSVKQYDFAVDLVRSAGTGKILASTAGRCVTSGHTQLARRIGSPAIGALSVQFCRLLTKVKAGFSAVACRGHEKREGVPRGPTSHPLGRDPQVHNAFNLQGVARVPP